MLPKVVTQGEYVCLIICENTTPVFGQRVAGGFTTTFLVYRYHFLPPVIPNPNNKGFIPRSGEGG